MKKKSAFLLILLLLTMVVVKPVYAKGNYEIKQIVEHSGGGHYPTNPSQNDSTDCDSLMGDPDDPDDPAYYITLAFDIIKYLALIILIVMSVIDFLGAVASHDEDILNKTIKKIGVRAIICVIIFLLPMLIRFALSYLDERAAQVCGLRG